MAGIAEAINNGQRRIKLQKGLYDGLDGDQINVTADDVTIVGEGDATVLKFTETTTDTCFLVGGSSSANNFVRRDLKLDGANQTLTARDLNYLGSENSREGHGVFLDDEQGVGVADSLVENVTFANIANEGHTAFGRTTGANELHAEVRDCTFINNKYRCLHPHNDHSVDTIACDFPD